jgi:branched-chain amino acid transport system substrate-binding protein
VISARHRYRCALVTALLLAAVAGCSGHSGSSRQASTVAIGFLAATTGPGADEGTDAIRGAQLAIDVVNLSYPDILVPLGPGTGLPGLGGATLTLVTGDTKGTPDDASNQVNTLVRSKNAAAVISMAPADVAAAAGNQTQRLRVPMLDAATSADYLTELGMDWYFRLTPTDHMFVATMYNLVSRQLGTASNRRVALLTEEGDANTTVSAALNDQLTRGGFPVVLRQSIATGRSDSGTLAHLIDKADVGIVVVLADESSNASAAAQTVARMSNPVPMLGLGAGFDGLGGGPTLAPVVLRASAWSAEFDTRDPVGRAVSGLYRRRFGTAMTPAAANGFTATIALAAAIDAAGSSDPGAIRSSLRQLWLPATQTIMPWNGIQFDVNGQNQLAAPVIELWGTGGFRVVFPRELASGPINWIGGR